MMNKQKEPDATLYIPGTPFEMKGKLSNIKEMTSFEIFKLGKKARADGNSVDSNPFEFGTKEYTYWWDGWND